MMYLMRRESEYRFNLTGRALEDFSEIYFCLRLPPLSFLATLGLHCGYIKREKSINPGYLHNREEKVIENKPVSHRGMSTDGCKQHIRIIPFHQNKETHGP